MPMSAGFNPYLDATLQGLCESTVYYGVASNRTVKSWLALRLSQRHRRFTKTLSACRSIVSLNTRKLDIQLKNSLDH
jgi:hypothetical protein